MVHLDKTLRFTIVCLTILSISLFACDINLALPAKPTAVSAAISFEVFANKKWQDTGVKVMPGKPLTILYLSGLWSPGEAAGMMASVREATPNAVAMLSWGSPMRL